MPYMQENDPRLPGAVPAERGPAARRFRSVPRRIENARRAVRWLERESDGQTLSERVAAVRRQIGA
jgi:hypothetical protein